MSDLLFQTDLPVCVESGGQPTIRRFCFKGSIFPENFTREEVVFPYNFYEAYTVLMRYKVGRAGRRLVMRLVGTPHIMHVHLCPDHLIVQIDGGSWLFVQPLIVAALEEALAFKKQLDSMLL